MNFWETTHWYAVHTKPAQERPACAHLQAAGVQTFLPLLRRPGARAARLVPLFSQYLLARFCPLAILDRVRFAPGVLRVVSSGNYPLPVEEELVTTLQERMGEDGCIELRPPPFQRGERVRVESGPLMGLAGRVECEWHDGRRVAILLEALQQARVLMESASLARVA
jgi:transcriptional antiterminator RfaH